MRILDDVPDYRRFLTVKELDESSFSLARKYPGVVGISEVGSSRNSYPIQCLKIGQGRRNAFVFGCPHPNEPIGAMMLAYLTERLAADDALREELGFTWHIIKCSDPDGTMLNEGWFPGPYTPLNYARNFFRPASHQQVEWTFPIHYKTLNFDRPIPETQALMKITDSVKPDFMFSLHNAGFGGAYWYLTDEAPQLYEQLARFALSQKVPLSLGEPEVPYATRFAQAVYRIPGSRDSYEYYAKFTDLDPATIISGGTSSADYAKEAAGTFTMVCEVPYFYDPRIEDLSPSDMVRKEAVLKSCDLSEQLYSFVSSYFSTILPLCGGDNPFRITLEDFLSSGIKVLAAKRKWAETDPGCAEVATVAEKFDNLQVSRFYGMLRLGLLMRCAEFELKRQSAPALNGVRDVAWDELVRSAGLLDKELNYSVIPIKNLVSVQLGSALAAATFIRDKK
jgi:hypothetical protein